MLYYPKIPYEEAFEYLSDYARDDWLELSIVVDHANQIAGAEAEDLEITEVTLQLVSDLLDEGAQPGNIRYGPIFVPWSGGKGEQLARITKEMKELEGLPYPGDICCFHVPETPQFTDDNQKQTNKGA